MASPRRILARLEEEKEIVEEFGELDRLGHLSATQHGTWHVNQ